MSRLRIVDGATAGAWVGSELKGRAGSVASEIDFDSTLVGGSLELAAAILGDQRFEAFRIGPRDLLTWNADKINPPPPR